MQFQFRAYGAEDRFEAIITHTMKVTKYNNDQGTDLEVIEIPEDYLARLRNTGKLIEALLISMKKIMEDLNSEEI